MNDNDRNGVVEFILMCIVCVVILCGGGFTRFEETKAVCETSGITHVEYTGWRPFAGMSLISTGFEGDLNGKHVSGVVTRGILKGNTIRITDITPSINNQEERKQ